MHGGGNGAGVEQNGLDDVCANFERKQCVGRTNTLMEMCESEISIAL